MNINTRVSFTNIHTCILTFSPVNNTCQHTSVWWIWPLSHMWEMRDVYVMKALKETCVVVLISFSRDGSLSRTTTHTGSDSWPTQSPLDVNLRVWRTCWMVFLQVWLCSWMCWKVKGHSRVTLVSLSCHCCNLLMCKWIPSFMSAHEKRGDHAVSSMSSLSRAFSVLWYDGLTGLYWPRSQDLTRLILHCRSVGWNGMIHSDWFVSWKPSDDIAQTNAYICLYVSHIIIWPCVSSHSSVTPGFIPPCLYVC